MRKSSVLVRRAALFTAIVVLISIVTGLAAVGISSHLQADRAALDQLLPQARMLAESAAANHTGGFAPKMDEVDLFALSGGTVWITDADRNTLNLTNDAPCSDTMAGRLPEVFDGRESTGSARVKNRHCVWAMIPVASKGAVVAVLTASLPANGLSPVTVIVGIVTALVLAASAGALIIHRVMRPALLPITSLRDVAVSMADGNLEARADENNDGELGELGRAVNELSLQLSRNMYTLIVERNRLRNMLNGLSEGIVAIDHEGKVTHTNPALDKFFTRQKLALHLPDPRMKLIPDKSIWEDFDSVIQSGEPMTRTMQSRDMILRLTITPIVDEIGSIAGAVGLFSDITQMERLEKTRRDYVSNVSHELRTPLTAMRALIEPLKEGMVKEEEDRQRYYDIILREIMRLSRLINDQLELSRLQSGTLSIQKSVISLDDVVYDVCDRYHSIAAEHGLDLIVDTDFSQCPPVYANADRVEQMLIILVDNAIKYTEKGSVTVWADWDDVRVVIHVKDTGIGIREEDLPYVFDRFYKVDKAHSGKGSGLGLSIAKELLKQMDEEIWVTSEKDEGTEFSFTIHRPVKDGESEDS